MNMRISEAFETLYSESLAFSRKWKITSEEVSALHNMGEVYLRRGQLLSAEENFKAAQNIYRRINDRIGETGTQFGIANIYNRSGRYADALKIYYQVLGIFQRSKEKEYEAYVLDSIASVYYSTGRYETALGPLRESLALFQELQDKNRQAAALNNFGIRSCLRIYADVR